MFKNTLNSFIVVLYDSSTILYAALSKKPMINIKSEMFERVNYKTDMYNKSLNLKQINIYKDFNFNKTEFMKDLNKRAKCYKKFFNKYLPKKKTPEMIKL